MSVLKAIFTNKNKKEMGFEEMMGPIEQSALEYPNLIEANEASRKRNEISGGNPVQNMSIKRKFAVIPIMLKNMRELKRSFTKIKRESQKSEISSDELDELNKLARKLGVESIGFTKLNPSDIFKEKGVLFDNVIVFTAEMDANAISKAPDFETFLMIQETYAQTGVIANNIAKFLHKKGFGAQAGHGLGGLSIYPVLAERAGLGVFGRHGLIISPKCGPRQRLGVVYTNISNLPVHSGENPHKWVEDYCATCGRCIRKCPGEAIKESPDIDEYGNKKFIDYEKCLKIFTTQYGCTVCVKECMFTRVGYEKLHQKWQTKKA